MSTLSDSEVFLTVKQAREIIALSAAWFAKCRWLKSGSPYLKIGSKIFYRKSDLAAYAEQHMRGPEQQKEAA